MAAMGLGLDYLFMVAYPAAICLGLLLLALPVLMAATVCPGLPAQLAAMARLDLRALLGLPHKPAYISSVPPPLR